MSRRGPGPARYSLEQLATTGEDAWLTTAEVACVIEAVDKCYPELIPDPTTAAMCSYALMANHSDSASAVSIVTHSWTNARRRAAAAQYCQATGEDRAALARRLGLGWIPLRVRPTF